MIPTSMHQVISSLVFRCLAIKNWSKGRSGNETILHQVAVSYQYKYESSFFPTGSRTFHCCVTVD